MPGAGDLRDRITFVERQPDARGDRLGDWVDQFSVAAQMLALRGTESVMAARLSGAQPYALAIRATSRTARITTDWRAYNARRPAQTFNIRSIAPNPKDRAFLDVLVEEGRADGL